MSDIDDFFADYADSYNQALGDKPDYARIRAFFTDCFLAAGPGGVACGKNDEAFEATLKSGYDFYRALRTRKMTFLRAQATPIDEGHVMAKVFYRADYERPSGEPLSIDFDLTYLLERGEKLRVFGFIAGDEMALYKQVGLVDEAGKPV